MAKFLFISSVCILINILMPSRGFAELKTKDFLGKRHIDAAQMYMAGVTQSAEWYNVLSRRDNGKQLYCPPRNLAINLEQYISILEHFVAKKPAAADQPAAYMMLEALVDTFPCSERN